MMNFRRNLVVAELAAKLDQAMPPVGAHPHNGSYSEVIAAAQEGTTDAFLKSFRKVRCSTTGCDGSSCEREVHEFANQFYDREREMIAELLLRAQSPEVDE